MIQTITTIGNFSLLGMSREGRLDQQIAALPTFPSFEDAAAVESMLSEAQEINLSWSSISSKILLIFASVLVSRGRFVVSDELMERAEKVLEEAQRKANLELTVEEASEYLAAHPNIDKQTLEVIVMNVAGADVLEWGEKEYLTEEGFENAFKIRMTDGQVRLLVQIAKDQDARLPEIYQLAVQRKGKLADPGKEHDVYNYLYA